jgi:carboxyl-terminal processing protease
MVKRSSAIIACAVICVFTLVIGSTLGMAADRLWLTASGQLQRVSQPEATQAGEAAEPPADYSRLDEIRDVIHGQALEDVSDEDLLVGAAKGMVANTGDRYAQFFTKEEFAEFQQQEAGDYVGIGVSVNVDPADELITAVNVYKDSPAEKGGMLPGDKIVKVDDTDVAGMGLEQVVKLVRGEAGTQVRVTVLRGNETVELTMTRAHVATNFTEWKMLQNGIGYIKILEFSGNIESDNNAAALFDRAVRELKAQGMKGFILDLRNNPGGSLNIVAPIADMLFPKGPIITMVDRTGSEVKDSRIESDEAHIGLPMVVLINENSASASELLSGGIQDYRVGTLVGVTTYGKGVAQSFATLSDGSVVKFTADKYLTGGGRSPQSVGIRPDIEVKLAKEVEDNPLLLCTDKDNQYTAAIDELKKMIGQ